MEACVINCCSRRNSRDIPEYHCFGLDQHDGSTNQNIIGCRQMQLNISPSSGLYRTGKWLDIFGNYEFDKAKIRTRTNKLINQFQSCPYIKANTITKFIDLWPTVINAFVDPRWKAYPPREDSFSRGLKDLGLECNAEMFEEYQPRFPIITDVSLLVDLARDLYDETPPIDIQRAIYSSINVVKLEVFRIYS
jgi:hypothetical protein